MILTTNHQVPLFFQKTLIVKRRTVYWRTLIHQANGGQNYYVFLISLKYLTTLTAAALCRRAFDNCFLLLRIEEPRPDPWGSYAPVSVSILIL